MGISIHITANVGSALSRKQPICPDCKKRHKPSVASPDNPNGYFHVGVTECSGCNTPYYHLQLHPDRPNTQWCMNCFGSVFGVDVMLQQRKFKEAEAEVEGHESGYTYVELWEKPASEFKDLVALDKPKNMAEYNKIKDTPDWVLSKYGNVEGHDF